MPLNAYQNAKRKLLETFPLGYFIYVVFNSLVIFLITDKLSYKINYIDQFL